MKDNIDIYKLLNENNNIDNYLEDIESSSDDNTEELVDDIFNLTLEQKNKILQNYKNEKNYYFNKTKRKSSIKTFSIIGTLVASLFIIFFVQGNNSIYAFIQNTIDNIQVSLNQVFSVSTSSDEYSGKYLGNAEEIGKYKVKIDKVLIDSHKVYINTLIGIPYDKEKLVYEISLNGIDFLVNGKPLTDDNGGSSGSQFICNTSDGYQIFSYSYELDIKERFNQKIDSLSICTHGINVVKYEKSVVVNAIKKFIETNDLKYLDETFSEENNITTNDNQKKNISFKINNADIELNSNTKEINENITFAKSDKKFVIKNLSYNNIGIQAVLDEYSNNGMNDLYTLIIATDNKGNKIELNTFVGNDIEDNGLKYVFSTTDNNIDIPLKDFMKSKKLSIQLFEEKGTSKFEEIDSIRYKEIYKNILANIIDKNAYLNPLNEFDKTSNMKLNKRINNAEKIGEIEINVETGSYKVIK